MGTAKYPEVNVRHAQSVQAQEVIQKKNLYSGEIPKCIVIGFVKNSGINGTYQTNSFQFCYGQYRVWVAHPFLVRHLNLIF